MYLPNNWLYVFIVLIPYTLAQRCPNGLSNVTELLAVNGPYCYYLSQREAVFSVAEEDCERNGGDLAPITDIETQKFLSGRLLLLIDDGQVADKVLYWLGGTYRSGGLRHTWITGENNTFSNFDGGRPNPRLQEECLLLALDLDGLWITADCSVSRWNYGYICRYATVPGSSESKGHKILAVSFFVILTRMLLARIIS